MLCSERAQPVVGSYPDRSEPVLYLSDSIDSLDLIVVCCRRQLNCFNLRSGLCGVGHGDSCTLHLAMVMSSVAYARHDDDTHKQQTADDNPSNRTSAQFVVLNINLACLHPK